MDLVAPMQGRFVRLEPLTPQLRDDVEAALASDPDAWSIMVSNGGPGGFDGWWAARLAGAERGAEVQFAVRRQVDQAIIGTTGFHEIRPEHRRLEIGSTFFRPDGRSGPVNPECKLMMLTRAFAQGAVRVEFLTDAINGRSRAAIVKLGATEEGVLRRHKVTWTGRVRDTVMFSITDAEWPEVKAGLERRLATF